MSRPEAVGIGLARETDTGGMRMSRKAVVTTALVAASIAASACTSTTAGTATVSASERAVATTTTPRPTTTAPQVDEYAALTKTVQAAMLDTSRFWASEGVVVPTRALVTTDPAEAPCAASRDAEREAQAVAWACDMVQPQTVVVNPENLESEVSARVGDVGTYIVLAHEQSHIGLPALTSATDTDDDVEERRADCGAGSYMAWVVSDQSPTISVTEDKVGRTTDAMWATSAPERQRAFVQGYVHGLQSCLTYRP